MDPTTFWLAYSFMAISTAYAIFCTFPTIKSRKDLLAQVISGSVLGAIWPVVITSQIIVRIINVK